MNTKRFTCEGCTNWKPHKLSRSEANKGQCHVVPPLADVQLKLSDLSRRYVANVTAWPTTLNTDFCGKGHWQLNDEALIELDRRRGIPTKDPT